ncbi:MAG TPA: hypothetical protein VHF22_10250 [Planctomycetota bacterium]|nr:hypothetical protein [Planctomycetota bacterium]
MAAFPPPAYYLDEAAAIEAVKRRKHFNLISTRDGDEVGFWLLTDEAFDASRFARRRPLQLCGIRASVSTPEDTIVQKLLWARKSGGSEKQFTDALRVYEVQAGALDPGYLSHWVEALGLGDSWKRLQAEAVPVEGAEPRPPARGE